MTAAVAADASPTRWPFRLDGLDGDRRGVLLIHGFSGTPFEMRLLGRVAARARPTRWRPRPSPATAPTPDARSPTSTWRDWVATVEPRSTRLRALRSRSRCAASRSAARSTLELARHGAAPRIADRLRSRPAMLLEPHLMRGIRKRVEARALGPQRIAIPKLGGSDIADRLMRKLNPHEEPADARARPAGGRSWITSPRTLGEIDRPRARHPRAQDHTIPFSCHGHAGRAALHGPVETLAPERSFHVITLDHEREQVFARVGDFFDLEQHLAPSLNVPRTGGAGDRWRAT